MRALVVSTNEINVLRKPEFQTQKNDYYFDRAFASIDVVTKEEISAFGRKSKNVKDFAKIFKITVDVTAD
jgi:hypothetical protein